jgi:hypothetical protein
MLCAQLQADDSHIRCICVPVVRTVSEVPCAWTRANGVGRSIDLHGAIKQTTLLLYVVKQGTYITILFLPNTRVTKNTTFGAVTFCYSLRQYANLDPFTLPQGFSSAAVSLNIGSGHLSCSWCWRMSILIRKVNLQIYVKGRTFDGRAAYGGLLMTIVRNCSGHFELQRNRGTSTATQTEATRR